MFTITEIKLAPKVYEAIKKIAERQGKRWEWRPKKGEWCIYENDNNLSLIIFVYNMRKTVILEREWYGEKEVNISECIPILHWETIEKILEEMEYYMSLPTRDERSDLWVVGFSHFNFRRENKEFRYYKDVYVGRGKTRQEAVMRAIIKLGEEVEK